MKCSRCGSGNSIKSGFSRGKQRFECKNCPCHFVESSHKAGAEEHRQVVKLYFSGVSFRQIARLQGVSHTTARRWVQQFASAVPEIPLKQGPVSVVELNEQWHFVKKSQKLWIWKAVDYETGQLLDWELGGRDTLTFRRLYKRIEQRFHPKLYCTDYGEAYRQVIPEERLIQSKSGTSRVESNNASTRHWFARFKRRTCVVSRCAQMVNLTLRLQTI